MFRKKAFQIIGWIVMGYQNENLVFLTSTLLGLSTYFGEIQEVG